MSEMTRADEKPNVADASEAEVDAAERQAQTNDAWKQARALSLLLAVAMIGGAEGSDLVDVPFVDFSFRGNGFQQFPGTNDEPFSLRPPTE